MPVGTSLGEGIGLQEQRRDNYWMGRIADDNAKKDAAEAKEREKADKALTTAMDFKWDAKGYLPPWGNAIAGIYSQTINDLAAARQGGKYIPEPLIQKKMLEAKQKASQYIEANERAKEYLSRKDIVQDPDVVRAMTSVDSDFTALSTMTEGNPFLRIGQQGEFSYYGIPSKTKDFKYGDPDKIEIERLKTIGRTPYNLEVQTYSDDAVGRVAEQISTDPVWAQQKMYELYKKDPQTYSMQPNENQGQYFERISQALVPFAEEEARRIMPPPTKNIRPGAVIPAPSGGTTKEKYKAPVQENVEATVRTGEYSVKLDAEGNETTDRKYKTGKAIRPIYQALNPQSKPVTVALNEGVIDANTNRPMKGSYSFSFKPDGIVAITQKGGGYKKYVMGTSVKPLTSGEDAESEVIYTVTDDKGKELTEKTTKLMIPYDGTGIASSIEAANDLVDFNDKFDKLRSGKKESTTNETVVTVTTQAQYDALPKGTKYKDSTGKLATKR